MRLREGVALDFDDVLLVPQRSSLDTRKNVEVTREFKFRHSQFIKTWCPCIAANMDTTGSFSMSKALYGQKMLTALHKFYSVEELSDFFSNNFSILENTFYTVGANQEDYDKLKRVQELLQMNNSGQYTVRTTDFPHLLCIDAANGYTSSFISWVEKYRKEFSHAIIMAGNVVTANMTEELILSGADIVKVGIGGGSCCLTRTKTGIGFPQLSAIDDCAHKAHGLQGHICSDGGCRTSADVCKAFATGADFVMLGSLFSGTDECDGKWQYCVEKNEGESFIVEGNNYEEVIDKYLKIDMAYTVKRHALRFHGMASREAMEQHNGGVASYRSVEGKEVLVPYKGSVNNIVADLLGSIRSCCSYMGARRLKDLPKCAEFQRVTRTHNTIFE
jgi:GMP reductase